MPRYEVILEKHPLSTGERDARVVTLDAPNEQAAEQRALGEVRRAEPGFAPARSSVRLVQHEGGR